MKIRVTTGAAAVKLHIVREGSDPLESVCGRAYAELQPEWMDSEDVLADHRMCHSCRRFSRLTGVLTTSASVEHKESDT